MGVVGGQQQFATQTLRVHLLGLDLETEKEREREGTEEGSGKRRNLSEPILGRGCDAAVFSEKKGLSVKGGRQFSEWGVW